MRAWPWKTSASAEPDGVLAVADLAAAGLGGDVFLSGGGRHGDRRWILGISPAETLTLNDDTTRDEIRDFAFQGPGPAMGFLSYGYGLGASLGIHRDPDFPGGLLRRYHALLEWDSGTGALEISADDPSLGRALAGLIASSTPEGLPQPVALGPASHSLDRRGYMAGVEETLDAIRDGQVYQLNLSIRTRVPFDADHGWPLFRTLFQRYPASHYAYVDTGRHRLISTSPERFLQVRGGSVRSMPIKGTGRLGPGIDEVAARAALTGSAKESAELSMIVDLIRNDISRSCDHGSVVVPVHKEVFRVDALLQMYSVVTGRLRGDRDVVDLLLDAFPGGSVTGCPKESAMSLIDGLEGYSRDIYCGSFVILRGPQDMDSSIAIRTAVADRETGLLRVDAGSGIVVDSDPASEYLETMAKAAKFMEVLGI